MIRHASMTGVASHGKRDRRPLRCMLLLCSALSLAACSTSTVSGPLPLNAFYAPEGRQHMVRTGTPRLARNQSMADVKALIGWPDIERPWRMPMPLGSLSRGELLGTEYQYWLQWGSFMEERSLNLKFDRNGRLVVWSGNVNGTHFTLPPGAVGY